jgi:hypothetical protein
MIGISRILFLLLLIPTMSFSSQYESSEHIAAGDQVKLFFSAEDPGQLGTQLLLPNGLKLTYGQIVSLGDFYGVVGKAISLGKTDADRRARFLAAFDTFARDPNAVTEMPKIFDVVKFEQDTISDAMKKGENLEEVYARIADDDNRQWNCVTGGGCDAKTWFLKPGRYLKLAKQDYDHFNANAWSVYQTGHQLALETAIAAHQTEDLQKLSLAYALNGFACHFLSDRFASGHIRTPRVELPANVTPSVIGSLLVSFMHSEENHFGLHMHNLRGDRWTAYGDRHYYDLNNKTNVNIMQDALQDSANEIFAAYKDGALPSSDPVSEAIPIPDEIGNAGTIDIAPLFYWDAASRILYRRMDTANPQDRHWTAHWLGWNTLIILARQHGVPASVQAQLVEAGYADEAIRYGLITDKNVLEFARQVK